jgi:hypothetical protein
MGVGESREFPSAQVKATQHLPGGLYTFHHQAPHFQTMEAIMAEQPVIHVKVRPDLSEMKTLLHGIIDCIDNYGQQGNENRES